MHLQGGFVLEIKNIDRNQRDTAIQLVLAVFMQFEAPDYSVEGVETFKRTAIYNNDFLDGLNMYGAYDSETPFRSNCNEK